MKVTLSSPWFYNSRLYDAGVNEFPDTMDRKLFPKSAKFVLEPKVEAPKVDPTKLKL